MTIETILVYEAGRFTSIPLPDWFERAVAICSGERLDWHKAVSKAIGAEHQGFTVEPTGQAGIEIGFWYSMQNGVYVEIDTVLGNVEQVLIIDPADWLPFVSAHLTPLLAAVSQAETARQLERVANALISFGRHEHGEHIDRNTGRSRIDQKREETIWARQRTQASP